MTDEQPQRGGVRDAEIENESSILFRRPFVLQLKSPDHFVDLGLDIFVATAIEGREQFQLAPYFSTPLCDPEDIKFRQAAFAEVVSLRALFVPFAARLQQMRDRIRLGAKMSHPLQKAALHLEAAGLYVGGVEELLASLAATPLASSALLRYRDALEHLANSERFHSLKHDHIEISKALGAIRYTVNLWPGQLTVSPTANLHDLTAEVELTFARFQQGSGRDYRIHIGETLEMNRIETEILDRVAQLNPQQFGRLTGFARDTADWFPSTLVSNFDRELAFVFACSDVVERLQKVGLQFTMPVLAEERRLLVSDSFDIGLALKLARNEITIVTNGFTLDPPEQFLIVTGPNQGGKTTFARMFGGIHYLAMLGIPVPGSVVELPVPDRIFTHFEREEDAHSGHGKLEDELLRVHEIIVSATSHSVVILNEMFASTTLADSIDLGTRVLNRLTEIGAIGVCVTFVDELSELTDAMVSMVADVIAEPPHSPTFTLGRRPADGVAYALSIASRHQLSYEQLEARLS